MKMWKITFTIAFLLGLLFGMFLGAWFFREKETITVIDKKATVLQYATILSLNNITATEKENPITLLWHPSERIPFISFNNWLKFLQENNIKECFWTLSGFEGVRTEDAGFWYLDDNSNFYYWRIQF